MFEDSCVWCGRQPCPGLSGASLLNFVVTTHGGWVLCWLKVKLLPVSLTGSSPFTWSSACSWTFLCLSFLQRELINLFPFLFFLPLDYLLSNNYVNSIIVHKFDFSDEEIMAYYISFLKTLSLKLNNHTVHFFYNEVSSCTEACLFGSWPVQAAPLVWVTLCLFTKHICIHHFLIHYFIATLFDLGVFFFFSIEQVTFSVFNVKFNLCYLRAWYSW